MFSFSFCWILFLVFSGKFCYITLVLTLLLRRLLHLRHFFLSLCLSSHRRFLFCCCCSPFICDFTYLSISSLRICLVVDAQNGKISMCILDYLYVHVCAREKSGSTEIIHDKKLHNEYEYILRIWVKLDKFKSFAFTFQFGCFLFAPSDLVCSFAFLHISPFDWNRKWYVFHWRVKYGSAKNSCRFQAMCVRVCMFILFFHLLLLLLLVFLLFISYSFCRY